MAEARIYFDWNAGAPLAPAARACLVDWLGRPGNGSSVHQEGRAAHAAMETARRDVARLVGADFRGVTFCSGGTEAANTVLTPDWTLFGKPFPLDRLVVSAIEHPAVLRGGRFPADRLDVIPVDGNGLVDLDWLDRHLGALGASGQRALVSVMAANNETGVVEPVAEVARIVHAHGGLAHTDAVQAAGKTALDVEKLGVDVLTVSSHKIGGPQGVGAIVRGQNGFAFAPLMTGGGQEQGARAGTENVAGIAAFGSAARAALDELGHLDAIAGRRRRLEDIVRAAAPEVVVFGESVPRLANTLCFAVPETSAETTVIAFDLAGVALSSGSACSSGKVKASHVLAAMGVDGALARGGLRISIGTTTTDAEIERFSLICDKVLGAMKKQHGTRVA